MTTFSTFTGFETVTVAGTAISLTAATYLNNSKAFIMVETAAVRYTVDGTTPTATVGHYLEPGDTLILGSRDQIVKFLAIRRDGVSATLSVSYGVS